MKYIHITPSKTDAQRVAINFSRVIKAQKLKRKAAIGIVPKNIVKQLTVRGGNWKKVHYGVYFKKIK